MDVILVVVGFLLVTFAGALIRHDSVHWAIALGRLMVRLATRLQTETEREACGTEAEYESMAGAAEEGRRALSTLLWFGVSHLSSVVGRSWRPAVRRLGDGALRRFERRAMVRRERRMLASIRAEVWPTGEPRGELRAFDEEARSYLRELKERG